MAGHHASPAGLDTYRVSNIAELAHLANESASCVRSMRSDLLFLSHPEANPRQVLGRLHKSNLALLRGAQSMISPLVSGPACLQSSPALVLPQDSAAGHVELAEKLQRLSRWTKRTHEMALVAQNELQSVVMLKRSDLSVVARRTFSRPTPPIHRQANVLLGSILPELNQHHRLKILKQTENTVVLHAFVDNVFYALLLFRGCIIDHVLVRGLDEPLSPRGDAAPNNVDVYSPSKYRVFQKVSDYATVALLHFKSTQFPNVAIKSYLRWLNSYKDLFSTKCANCGRHMVDGLPPVWRDTRKLEPLHEACKP